jgi:PPOX class probable FMN-dependent enzyme
LLLVDEHAAASPDSVIGSVEQLQALYPPANPRSVAKESDVLTPGYAELIAASPFAILASRGPQGLDCSPRGDRPGFVKVLDERTLLLPDRRGNNRLDTLRNVLHDPAIALIFLIPGIGETIRVRGTAMISTDPELLARTAHDGIEPATVVVITVQKVYFQCQRAVIRGALWDPGAQVKDRSTLPTAGRLQAEVGVLSQQAADAYDATLDDYARATLYQGESKP